MSEQVAEPVGSPVTTEAPTADTPPSPAKRARRTSTRRARTPRKDTRPRQPRPPAAARPKPLAARVTGAYLTLGIVGEVAPVPKALTACTSTWAGSAEQLGEAWAAYAKTNPRVAEWLDRLLTMSELGTLLSLHLPGVLAALGEAGMIPAGAAAAVQVAAAPAGCAGTPDCASSAHHPACPAAVTDAAAA